MKPQLKIHKFQRGDMFVKIQVPLDFSEEQQKEFLDFHKEKNGVNSRWKEVEVYEYPKS